MWMIPSISLCMGKNLSRCVLSVSFSVDFLKSFFGVDVSSSSSSSSFYSSSTVIAIVFFMFLFSGNHITIPFTCVERPLWVFGSRFNCYMYLVAWSLLALSRSISQRAYNKHTHTHINMHTFFFPPIETHAIELHVKFQRAKEEMRRIRITRRTLPITTNTCRIFYSWNLSLSRSLLFIRFRIFSRYEYKWTN